MCGSFVDGWCGGQRTVGRSVCVQDEMDAGAGNPFSVANSSSLVILYWFLLSFFFGLYLLQVGYNAIVATDAIGFDEKPQSLQLIDGHIVKKVASRHDFHEIQLIGVQEVFLCEKD